MPLVGLGTFQSKSGEVGTAVKKALEIGYRSIDCAAGYENEAEIGKALQEVFSQGKIKREDVFITSKLWAAKNDPAEVHDAIKQTLKDLQLDYLDLYLIHQPVPVDAKNGFKYKKRTGYGLQDLWRAMEKVQKEGLTRSIGVSNYNSALISDIQNYAHVMPAVNQIERHPYCAQLDHNKFCKEIGITVTAYAPLGAPGSFESGVLDNSVIKDLSKKYNKTPAQIAIRWQMDSGVVVIPKSVHEERIKENFGVFDFSLTEDEVKQINGLDKNKRLFAQDWMGVPLFQ